jgi:hypothetical protein
MSVFVKPILTLQRQVRNLTRRINRISGGETAGGIISADTTISDDVIQGNYMITNDAEITLPSPVVGTKLYFMIGASELEANINLTSGNTFTGSVLVYDNSASTFSRIQRDGSTDSIGLSSQLIGSYLEITCVSETQWTFTGMLYQA